MLPQSQSKPTRPRGQAPRNGRTIKISLTELTGGSFLICIRGRLNPEEVEKVLPRHAECFALENGGVAAIAHIRAEHVRPLLDRLGERSTEIGFGPPSVGVPGLGL